MGKKNTQPPSPLTTVLPTHLQTHLCSFLSLNELAAVVRTCRTLAFASKCESSRRCMVRISTDICAPARRREWWQRLLFASLVYPRPLDTHLSTPLTHHITALALHPPTFDPSLSTYYDCRQFDSLSVFRSLERLAFFLGTGVPSAPIMSGVFHSLSHTLRYVNVDTRVYMPPESSVSCRHPSTFPPCEERVQMLLHALPLLIHLRSLTLHIYWRDMKNYTHIDFSPLTHASSLRFLTMSLPHLPTHTCVDPLLLHWFNQQLQVIRTLAQRLILADVGLINSDSRPSAREEAIIASLAQQTAEVSTAPTFLSPPLPFSSFFSSSYWSSSSSSTSLSVAVGVSSSSPLPTIGIQQIGVDFYLYHRSLSLLLPLSSSLTTLHFEVSWSTAEQWPHIHAFKQLRRLCLRPCMHDWKEKGSEIWTKALTCTRTNKASAEDGAEQKTSSGNTALNIHTVADSSEGSRTGGDGHRCSLLRPRSSPASTTRTCCRHLHSLALEGCLINEHQLEWLACAHSQLHTLVLSDCCYTANALSVLPHFPHLTTLVLSHCVEAMWVIPDDTIQRSDFNSQWPHILQCTSLRRLFIYTQLPLPDNIIGKQRASDFPTLPLLQHYSCLELSPQPTRAPPLSPLQRCTPLHIWQPAIDFITAHERNHYWPSSAEYEAAFDEVQ